MRSNPLHTLARVPGIRARFGAIAASACALTLAACGGGSDEGTIPQNEGDAIVRQREEVDQLVPDGECDAAEDGALQVAEAISNLPSEVDGELRQTLISASGRLVEQTRDPNQCEEPEPEPPPTGASGEEGVFPEEDGG